MQMRRTIDLRNSVLSNCLAGMLGGAPAMWQSPESPHSKPSAMKQADSANMNDQPALVVFSGGTAFNSVAGKSQAQSSTNS